MWLHSALLVIAIAIQVIEAKKDLEEKDNVPRFVIPQHERQESVFLPEATLTKKSGSIVGTELPGAYGDDFEMDTGYESGSGGGVSSVSGSGAGNEKDDVIFVARDGEAAESAGKYGNNLAPMPSINPATAFVNHEKESDDEEADDEKGQIHASNPHKKESNGEKTEKNDKTEKTEKIEKSEKTVETTSSEPIQVDKTDKTEKPKSTKKRTKVKAKQSSPDENNMISKIDAIARQIERVEHKEKLDRKEEATLKVAKKVAKKVIKSIAAKKQKATVEKKVVKSVPKPKEVVKEPKSDTNEKKEATHIDLPKEASDCPPSHPYAYSGGSRCCNINQDKLGATLSLTSESCDSDHDKDCPSGLCKDNKLFIGPEGFECPWACFWSCHSYCPTECCHNPYKCDYACREICTPYCSNRCCAPGSQRLPKLQLTFPYDTKNSSVVKPKAPVKVTPGKVVDTAENAKMNPAESSYQQEKEHEEKIAFASQMEALKKAASYAAHLMGLPQDCPLACARICLPGLCKQHCCARSLPRRPAIFPPGAPVVHSSTPVSSLLSQSIPATLPGNPGSPVEESAADSNSLAFSTSSSMVPKALVDPSVSQLALVNQLAMPQNQPQYASSKGPYAANSPLRELPANFEMNKIAYQNKLLQEKNAALAQYRATVYANQMRKNLQTETANQQLPEAICPYPSSPNCQSSFASPWLHNCPPICRTSCIPQCPNECCVPPPNATAGIV